MSILIDRSGTEIDNDFCARLHEQRQRVAQMILQKRSREIPFDLGLLNPFEIRTANPATEQIYGLQPYILLTVLVLWLIDSTRL